MADPNPPPSRTAQRRVLSVLTCFFTVPTSYVDSLGKKQSAAMQTEKETDACEMARNSVIGPKSHGLSA